MKNTTGDIILLHVYHKWRCYSMVPEIWSAITELFVMLDHFLPSYPANDPRNQIFEKMKKVPGEIVILHMCTISDNHIIYGSC